MRFKTEKAAYDDRCKSALVLGYLSAVLVTGCAHTPPPPGDACEPWRAGWIEYRAATCEYWRCDAASLRWQRVAVEEQCL